MRTTLEIRDDILRQVKEYAAARNISNGDAASEILEQGLHAEIPTKWENGILIFAPGPGAEKLTVEKALAMKDAMESETPWE
ncbi:MAG TPA: hypothetical protein VG225_13890 [Terracidiphilus sp.]|nr:hypothetical protein [Terracidiphilus sp.]